MQEARWYEKKPELSVICTLCRHRCTIQPGRRGICGVRENRSGTLFSLVYGRIAAEHDDPVEKKPIFHFLPGSKTYSIATVGCNFRCRHCQNHEIARFTIPENSVAPWMAATPESVVEKALAAGCLSLSFTYTEPTVFLEFALDTAQRAVDAGLKNIFVTNGYITPTALESAAPLIHAANIDLKGFDADFYRRICGSSLDATLSTIRDYQRRGIWIEITTLLIPGLNDDRRQLAGIAGFIADELGSDVPWHISRFFPMYQIHDRPPTSAASLQLAAQIGLDAGLNYVYTGNISNGRENTFCPACGKAVIVRAGYTLTAMDLRQGACRFCGRVVAGVWA